jgi:AraC-like DNA-binding protein
MSDARVRAAKRMLLDGDAPLTTIAIESGCASLQHFNTLFRKRTGQLPSAWRRRERHAR